MMALFVRRCGPFRGPVCRPSTLALALALGFAAIAARAEAPTADIQIILDHAKLIKLPEKVTTVVVGNPSIADASVQPGGLVVITGKSYGSTNFIALDRSGAVLMEKTVQVGEPAAELVVVYRGTSRETYTCAPVCQPRIMLGDNQQYFGVAITQSNVRSTLAQSTAQPR